MTALALALILSASASTGLWNDPSHSARVDFPATWTWEPGEGLMPGQVLLARHLPTGGGALVRFASVDEVLQAPERVRAQIGDLEGALTADRYARLIALSQDDGSQERSLYIGLSDTQGARVGRWVFTQPADDNEPERAWWHVFWRTPTHYAQLIAWAPIDTLPAFLPAMRELESRVSSPDFTAPDPLLYVARGRNCEGPAMVDRMAAVAASASFGTARAALGASDSGWTDPGRAQAELRAIAVLLEGVDQCVREEAAGVRACRVYERTSATERSATLQAALPGCIDDARIVQQALQVALTPRTASP